MALSQATQDAINQALADRDTAAQSDADHAAAVRAMTAAQAAEEVAKDDALARHQAALDSAHGALDALMAELSLPPNNPAATARKAPRRRNR